MLSDELKVIIAQIEQQGKKHFLDKATEEQISAFEGEHGLVFPSQYKEWLRFSDAGELFLPAGIQLYGVAHKPLIDINDDDDRGGKRYWKTPHLHVIVPKMVCNRTSKCNRTFHSDLSSHLYRL